MNRVLKLAFAGLSLAIATGLTVLALALPSLAHAGPNQVVSRHYPWTSDHLTLDVDANVSYHPAPAWQVTITAPERVLEQLVVQNGRIAAKGHGCFSLVPFCIGFGPNLHHAVDVSIAGPALHRVTLDSSGKVDLVGLRQDRLTVRINGSGAVTGSGTVDDSNLEIGGSGSITLDGLHQNRLTARISGSGTVAGSGSTRDLEADISGSGNMRLVRLTDENARVSVSGSGAVDISPTNSVSVSVSGSGDVRVHSHPQSLVMHVSGSGSVTERPADPSVAAR